MSKKGKRKQPLPPPPPPFHTTTDGRAAIAAYDERDYVGTLRCIKNSRSRYEKCPFYHHATAFILYKIVLGNKYDDDTNKKFIQDAAISALEASVQCSNSTTIAYFCACTLYDLARFNGEYDQVIQECNRALRIENPREPERSSFVFKDPSQEWEIEKTKQELRELIKKSERKKRWAAISSVEMIEESAKAAEKKVVEIKNQLARLGNLPEKEEMEQNPMREKLEERKKKQFADKFMANFEKANNARSFWNNEMSAEQKRSLFRVKREELEKHLTDRKEKDLLSEAIKFAKAQGEWKFWECCDCSEKFGDWQSCMEHLCDSHDLRIHHDLASILPKRVDEISHEMIVNGEWKPVDTAEAIKILENESKSESCNPDDSGRCAEKGQDEHKGFSDEDVPLTKQMGSESDEEASSIAPKDWPLSDDNKRIALLESLRSTFQFLLRYNFLVQADIDDVIQNAVAMLETRFSDSLLKNLGPKTLKLVCFLESSELNSIIHKLQHVSGTLSEDTDEQLTGAKTSDFKEAVVFDNNSSNLILDGILSCGTDVMSWLYVGQEVGEPLKLWASLRESNKGQRVKMFESFKVERSKFVRAYEERSKLSEKMDALLAVNGICAEETERREENPEYVRKTFESLLRERQTELEEIIDVINQFDDDDAAYQFELDFILNVLETEQPVTAYQFENTSRVHENLNQSDDYVEEKIISWRDQLGNDFSISQMTLKTVTIIRSIVSMRLFNLHLGQISAYDYRLILLPMLKSFIKVCARISQFS
ncbi:uncharacterized protein LOC112498919 [Citrus sinensis]|uniref:uncharacterized protein LOC112498919 n=1 Tax=Citrus sinensis TaxID=2711 RepID=UPI002277F8EE|nr:uncharacterized protein LOC112498919 [Citrus sinensis]